MSLFGVCLGKLQSKRLRPIHALRYPGLLKHRESAMGQNTLVPVRGARKGQGAEGC